MIMKAIAGGLSQRWLYSPTKMNDGPKKEWC